MDPKDFVEQMIAQNRVVVFSKTYCPYCTMAKASLKSVGLNNFTVVELENREDCGAIQDYLLSKTGSRTVCFLVLTCTVMKWNTLVLDGRAPDLA